MSAEIREDIGWGSRAVGRAWRAQSPRELEGRAWRAQTVHCATLVKNQRVALGAPAGRCAVCAYSLGFGLSLGNCNFLANAIRTPQAKLGNMHIARFWAELACNASQALGITNLLQGQALDFNKHHFLSAQATLSNNWSDAHSLANYFFCNDGVEFPLPTRFAPPWHYHVCARLAFGFVESSMGWEVSARNLSFTPLGNRFAHACCSGTG